MARRLLGVVIAVAGFVLSGCATMRVSSHVERGLDFSQYRTFDWGPRDALPVGDPRLDKDPFFRDQVEGAIEKQMAARGFERSPPPKHQTCGFTITRASTSASTSARRATPGIAMTTTSVLPA